MPEAELLKVSDLVLDYEVYPRTEVDSTHVTELADAIRAGRRHKNDEGLPPIIVCAKSHRVVDGFHRVAAHKRLRIKVIRGILMGFPTERDLFRYAVQASAAHGLRFSKYDKAHILSIADRLGLAEREVANALGMEVPRLRKMIDDRAAKGAEGDIVILKKPLRSLVGKTLTREQEEFNDRSLGNSGLTYIQQLIGLIKIGCLDLNDEEVRGALSELLSLLRERNAA